MFGVGLPSSRSYDRVEERREEARQERRKNVMIGVGACALVGLWVFRHRGAINTVLDTVPHTPKPTQTLPIYLKSIGTTSIRISQIVYPVVSKATTSLITVTPEDTENFVINNDLLNFSLHTTIKDSVQAPDFSLKTMDEINKSLGKYHLRATDIKPMDDRTKVDRRENLSDSYFYVRHGVTDWNKKVFEKNGPMDLPLSEQGVKDVKQAVLDLGNRKATVIATAPSLRTIQTAEFFSRHFGLPYFVCDALKPRDVGSWEAIKDKLPEILASEDENSPDFYEKIKGKLELIYPAEAESLEAFKLRTSSAILSILRMQKQIPIIVGHGSVLRTFVESYKVEYNRLGLERKYGTVFELERIVRKQVDSADLEPNTNYTGDIGDSGLGS